MNYSKNSLFLLICWIGLICTLSCDNKTEVRKTTPLPPSKLTLKPAPTFSADSAYQYVKNQVDFGPRVPNSSAHRACGDYLVSYFKQLAWDVQEQRFEATAYNGTILDSRNIIASYFPQKQKRILLCAHWDARPYNDKEVEDSTAFEPIDGANDGASGVAVLMEIARVIALADSTLEVGIDIILFDSEDYGPPEGQEIPGRAEYWCLGSQHWGKTPHTPNYVAYQGILLDMVGAANAKFYMEGHSMQYAPKLTRLVWKIAGQLGYGQYFVNQTSPAILDDHLYVNTLRKIPTIDIVDFDPSRSNFFFPEYHHTHQDNIQIIDVNTLKAVGQTVLQVLYQESGDFQ